MIFLIKGLAASLLAVYWSSLPRILYAEECPFHSSPSEAISSLLRVDQLASELGGDPFALANALLSGDYFDSWSAYVQIYVATLFLSEEEFGFALTHLKQAQYLTIRHQQCWSTDTRELIFGLSTVAINGILQEGERQYFYSFNSTLRLPTIERSSGDFDGMVACFRNWTAQSENHISLGEFCGHR